MEFLISTLILVSILCQSRLFLLPVVVEFKREEQTSIHPLSIEAISPAWILKQLSIVHHLVSILCQSRLFLLPVQLPWGHYLPSWYPSSVNRGYFSCQVSAQSRWFLLMSIHPLSIEAISPASARDGFGSRAKLYPSSVNRGYFSC